MRQIVYKDSKNRDVRKTWTMDIAGAVVLHLNNNNFFIHRCADVYEFLCNVRYGFFSNAWIQKHGVDYNKQPEIYISKDSTIKVDLANLYASIVNLYLNKHQIDNVRCHEFDSVELNQADYNNFLNRKNREEDFSTIWKTDEENQTDNQFKQEQERLQTEQKNKENKEALKKVQEYEQSLVAKHVKELNKFKKSVGITVPKTKYNKQAKEKMAWKMFQ